MKTIELKTNIMCGSCVAKITKVLNHTAGDANWKVDTKSPQKVLSVTNANLTMAEVIEVVETAGFKAEPLP